MPVLDYSYVPQYGVEPGLSAGAAGAVVTGDNLIISMWTVEEKGAEPPLPDITIGDFVVPAEYDTSSPATLRPAYINSMHSRCSAKFYFGPSETKDSPFIWPLFAVLNPPPEFKQQMAGAVRFLGGSVTDLANYEIVKSLQSCNAWEFSGMLVDSAMNRLEPAIEAGWAFSTYLQLDPFGFDLAYALPFLRTNGADGVTPEFYDATTEAGVRAMIAAVDRGDFYVGAILNPVFGDDLGGAYAEVRWPHSTARG